MCTVSYPPTLKLLQTTFENNCGKRRNCFLILYHIMTTYIGPKEEDF